MCAIVHKVGMPLAVFCATHETEIIFQPGAIIMNRLLNFAAVVSAVLFTSGTAMAEGCPVSILDPFDLEATDIDRIPEPTREKARACLLYGIAVALASTKAEEPACVARFLDRRAAQSRDRGQDLRVLLPKTRPGRVHHNDGTQPLRLGRQWHEDQRREIGRASCRERV